MSRRSIARRIAASLTAVASASAPAAAQDLEPRAYAASPVGATFLVVGVGRSTGDVFTEPSVPLEDVKATITAATAGIGHTFSLLSRTALAVVVVPYAWGHASGRTGETALEVERAGWGDARVKLSVHLLGGRALTPAEFAGRSRSTIVGVSLAAAIPTGRYHADRLVNVGTNRWSFKPEVGLSVPAGRWTLDAYGAVLLFETNDAFYPGTARREQNPIAAVQAHASYTVRPRLWLAVNATWYSGGTSTVDGVERSDLQRNSRLGATLSLPLGARQSLKAAFSTGATTRVGGDFNTLSLAWQMLWVR